MRNALADCDMLILSGGTSKGAGDVTYRILARLGPPGVVVHGVALKPGKPLCLAVCDGKPVVVLPGFPTSAMFTFHDMILPLLAPHGGPTAAGGRPGRGAGSRAHRFRARARRIRDGLAGPGTGRPRRLSDGQGFGRDLRLRPGRRLPAHRGARRPPAPGQHGAGHALRAACAGARPRHHRQPLHGARPGGRAAGPGRAVGPHPGGRQPRRARGRAPRRMRPGADPPPRCRQRGLQPAVSR